MSFYKIKIKSNKLKMFSSNLFFKNEENKKLNLTKT